MKYYLVYSKWDKKKNKFNKEREYICFSDENLEEQDIWFFINNLKEKMDIFIHYLDKNGMLVEELIQQKLGNFKKG